MGFTSLVVTLVLALVTLSAADSVAQTKCSETMDLASAFKISVQREGENLRLVIEPPACSGLKIYSVSKALELTQGTRDLTGKVRGLSGAYEPGEKAVIGKNLAESNPFLEPGDLAALKGALILKGAIAVDYEWVKSKAARMRARLNIPVSLQVEAGL